MKKHLHRFVVAAICCVVFFASLNTVAAQDKVNYSGTYSLQGSAKKGHTEKNLTLQVVQNDQYIEVTRVIQDKKTTNRFPLNGSDADYTSPTGVPGKCRALAKGKDLFLETITSVKPDPNAQAHRIHTKERWQLSGDSNVLTIRTEVDFPDAPAGLSATVGNSLSRTDKYERIGNK